MILVTGCAGFIGYHLTQKLLDKKKKVLGIDKIDGYYDRKLKLTRIKNLNNHKKFIFKKIDLNNKKKLFNILKKKKINCVIHLAAQPGVRVSLKNPHNTLYQNINSFINVIEMVRILNIKNLSMLLQALFMVKQKLTHLLKMIKVIFLFQYMAQVKFAMST